MRNKLIDYRQKLNMSQAQMAAFLGVNRQQYNRWERQHVQPDIDTLVKLWEILKVPFPCMNLQDLLE
jgi:DNA-binding XRE family transcriptional regulator